MGCRCQWSDQQHGDCRYKGKRPYHHVGVIDLYPVLLKVEKLHTRRPTGEWAAQQARNLSITLAERPHPVSFWCVMETPSPLPTFKVVLDYKIDQLGRYGSYAGMVFVGGTWYARECRSR
jgi:hypothetical protein